MSGAFARIVGAFLAVVLILSVPSRLDAQITRHIKEAAAQGLADRVQRSEEHLLEQTALAADSAAGTVLNPVDKAVAGAAAGAESAVTYIAAKLGSDVNADGLMADGLDAGRLDLAGVFEAGTAELSADGGDTLGRLADLLVSRGGSYLVEGRATWDEEPGLGKERALAAKSELNAAGVTLEQLFATGGGEAVLLEDGTPVTLSVRPLD